MKGTDPATPEGTDVFLSHSAEDKQIADAACHFLESAGFRCWIAPRDVPPGSNWGAAIIHAIESSRVMVLIFSANSNGSPQVLREVERAVSKGLPILPVRVAAVVPSRDLEYYISTQHWLDALTPPLEERLREVVRAVRVLLARGVTGTSVSPANEPAVAEEPLHAAERAITRKSNWRRVAAIAGMLALVVGASGLYRWQFQGRPVEITVDIAPSGWTALYFIHTTDTMWERFSNDPKAIIPMLGLDPRYYWYYEHYALTGAKPSGSGASSAAPIRREQNDPPGGYKHYEVSTKTRPDGSCVMTITLEREIFDIARAGGLSVILWVGGNTYRCRRLSESELKDGEDLRIEVSTDRVQ